MGDESNSSGTVTPQQNSAKIATWLAIAGGIIGLLAFFGITNFDQLRHAFFHYSASASTATPSPHLSASQEDKAACSLAGQALDYAPSQGSSPAAFATFDQAESNKLSNAAGDTVDQILQADLRNSSYAAQQLGTAFATGDYAAQNEWNNELSNDNWTWINYCDKVATN